VAEQLGLVIADGLSIYTDEQLKDLKEKFADYSQEAYFERYKGDFFCANITEIT
jgi:hypothetical protein